jgi:hypothetical protein
MQTPNVFIAYAPRGPGLRCAMAYLTSGRDAYGWFTGPRLDLVAASSYFLLADFFTGSAARYEAVDEADLHSAWSLEEPRRHELVLLRDLVAHEWLFYRDDPRGDAELEAYREAELAAPGEVNVRFERLSRFSTLQPNWTYYSPGFEASVLRHLAKRWPLEYRLDLDEAESR